MAEALKVGDLMRMSVELIEKLREQPDQMSSTVRVEEIRDEKDGTKTLFLSRVDE